MAKTSTKTPKQKKVVADGEKKKKRRAHAERTLYTIPLSKVKNAFHRTAPDARAKSSTLKLLANLLGMYTYRICRDINSTLYNEQRKRARPSDVTATLAQYFAAYPKEQTNYVRATKKIVDEYEKKRVELAAAKKKKDQDRVPNPLKDEVKEARDKYFSLRKEMMQNARVPAA